MHFYKKHIKWLFAQFLLLLTVFGIVIYFSFQFYLNSNEKINVQKNDLLELHEIITSANAITTELFTFESYSDEFIQSGINPKFDHVFTLLDQSATIIANTNNLKSVKFPEQYADTLNLLLANYRSTFRETILSLRESGNFNEGLKSNLYNLSWSICDTVSKYPILSSFMTDIKEYETAYLESPEIYEYNAIANLLNDLINNCYVIQDMNFNQAVNIQNINTYQSYLEDLHSLNQRIGLIQQNTGYINDLNNQFKEYKAVVSFIISEVSPIYKKLERRLKTAFFLYLSIVILAFIYFTFRIYTAFAKNISVLKTTVDTLTRNKNLSESNLPHAEYNFNEIQHKLIEYSNNIKTKEVFIQNLLEDNFEHEQLEIDTNDSLNKKLSLLNDKLKTTRDEQLEHTKQNELRRFINEGLAIFGTILRNNTENLDKLSFEFIKNTVNYFDALQGGLYLVSEKDSDVLELKASFAYNRKKYISKTIKKGDGLVGACALEQKPIILTDIPADYLEITSGLGDAPPKNLLIIPCVNDGVLEGVIEIASLSEFNDNQVELLQQIASNMAATLISVKSTEKTNLLLKKSQEQAAEMSEQEEEMRQNMEELKATQEESTRREDELNRFINAVNSSMLVITYDAEGTITHLNQKIVQFLRIGENEMIGKTHQELIKQDTVITNDLIKSVIEAGQIVSSEEITLRDSKYKLFYHLAPLTGGNDFTEGVINIISYTEVL